MALEQAPIPLTLAAYQALPEDSRAELVEGFLVMTPAPSWRHQRVKLRLASALEAFVRAHQLGVVLDAPFDVLLNPAEPATSLQPDVLYLSRANAGRLTSGGLIGAPDLVIEVLSPSNARYDSHMKRKLYEAYGAVEYWLVLPDSDHIDVLVRAADGGFGPTRRVAAPALLSTPLLPGFELDLARLFEPELL